MKNIIKIITALSIIVLFIGCQKYELPTTFQIANDRPSGDQYLGSTMQNIKILKYNNSVLVDSLTINDLKTGLKSSIFDAENCNNIKVYFNANGSSYVFVNKWTLNPQTRNIICYNNKPSDM